MDDEATGPGIGRRRLLALAVASLAAGCARSPAPPVGPRPTFRPNRSPARGLWYRVEAGDTLSAIARRGALAVAQIVTANNLRTTVIKPGQRLWLPGATRLGVDPLAGRLTRQAEPPTTRPTPSRSPAPRDRDYRLIRRRQWTKAPVGRNHRKMNGVTRLTVHHTGEYAGTGALPDREIVRRIDRYHREGRGWAAIGYHFLVGRDGTVYEGRPASLQGAHTRGANSHNLGISVMGDCHTASPTPAQLATLARLLEDLRKRYGVPKQRIYGHRDLSPSICPGDRLYAWVERYRA